MTAARRWRKFKLSTTGDSCSQPAGFEVIQLSWSLHSARSKSCRTMSENSATSKDLPDPRPYSDLANSATAPGFVLLLAFLLRLWKASGTFLNLDEAMHCLAATKPSLAEAYRAGLGLAHPPLLILLSNLWRRFGTSELFLRLPSVIAGTIFCWIFFKWLTRLLNPAAAWTGFVLVSFLPPFVELSAEIRQYALSALLPDRGSVFS